MDNKRILVLMSTYNGEKYLEAQIDSVLSQKDVNVDLLVRDDGSSDKTCEILQKYSAEGKLKWFQGKNVKPAKSFMDLVFTCSGYEYYAFCDQDDVWFDDKLQIAVNQLEQFPPDKPALYYGCTTLVDEYLHPIASTKENISFTRFCEAVISSNAPGCTMCFNEALRKTILIYRPEYQIMHDGWIHKVCLAVGGNLYYDSQPHMMYRQHGSNVVGGIITNKKRWQRRINTMKQDKCPRSRGIRELYNGYSSYMSEENNEICKKIIHYKSRIDNRIRLVFDRSISSPSPRIDLLYRLTVLLGIF